MKLLKRILKGKRVAGEPLPPVVLSVGHRSDRPDFFAWCREFNVGKRTTTLAMYYTNSNPQQEC